MMPTDLDLVQEYARSKSEEAFATLVTRHINLVYSVSLRLVGDVHLAEEITQSVFIILARKARSLSSKTIVAGWLCRTARYASAKALTLRRRQQRLEQESLMHSASHEPESDAWMQIAPVLDTAMAQLGEKDHNALVLRFLQGRSFKEVSSALGTTEAGAKMRVGRALEKLRNVLAKRGLILSAAVIAGAVSANSVQAAPLGLSASVTAAAIEGTTVTASTSIIIETTLKLMAWTKLKTTVVVVAVGIVITGTVTVTLHHAVHHKAAPLVFAGYLTPEATIQSSIWAGSRGDFQTFLAGCTPGQVERFKAKMAGKSDEEIRREAIAWADAVAGYKITQKEVIADDEVHLHLRARPSANGLRNGNVIVTLKKIDDEWKQDGDR
ncbi:MAG TPA: sigma-70 family RNA polymerase sigma factor [Verrucomicrobiota bacterium]|nr:sigma-70 family RNA polymerase sigma factor [Verrucomicrobiota bacterium]